MGPVLVIVSPCFRENVNATCTIVSFLCSCWPPAMLEGPFNFHLSRCSAFCMYVCMCKDVCTDVIDVGFSSTSKSKPPLSNENANTDFRQTWYVGSGRHKYYPRGLLSPNAHI